MLHHPLTEPSTPVLKIVAVDASYANFSAPTRSRLAAIPLPAHELPHIINEFSLRRAGPRPNQSGTATPLRPQHRPRNSPHAQKPVSRAPTPNRRLSDHVSIRKRRRSSTGVLYDSWYTEGVTRDFLRLVSRTLVREKTQRADEPHERMYSALDQQHRIQSVSPEGYAADVTNDFEYSLPLPAEDGLNSPEANSPLPSPQKQEDPKVPVFKSYLERILENRKNKRHPLVMDGKGSSSGGSRQEDVKNMISTSKFIIEHTLSGLPDFLRDEESLHHNLRLADPVAFENLIAASLSEESSDKENLLPLAPGLADTRLQETAFSNEFAEPLHSTKFENIDELDVPSWDPVQIYNDSIDDPDQDANERQSEEAEHDVTAPFEDASIILGHFTIEHDSADELLAAITDSNHGFEHVSNVTPPRARDVPRLSSTRERIQVRSAIPQTLVKGSLRLSQRFANGNHKFESSKKRKARRMTPEMIRLITAKSNEFLQQVMSDLSAYANHRQSKKIEISDAVLYLKRQRFNTNLPDNYANISSLAQTVLPLENLMILDNSLQESFKKSMRRVRKPDTTEELVPRGSSSESPDANESLPEESDNDKDEDYTE